MRTDGMKKDVDRLRARAGLKRNDIDCVQHMIIGEVRNEAGEIERDPTGETGWGVVGVLEAVRQEDGFFSPSCWLPEDEWPAHQEAFEKQEKARKVALRDRRMNGVNRRPR